MAEFALAYEDGNKVDYDFWMTSSSNRALDFIEDFKVFQEKLGANVTFTPHYVFWECVGCDKKYIQNDCYGGGKYCAVEPSNVNIKGREIIEEDLRQKCLYNNLAKNKNTSMWFSYIERAHSTCRTILNEDCSKRVHDYLGLDFTATMTCMENSFSAPKANWEKSTCKNSIID